MLLPSAASSLVLFTIGPKKRQNDLVSVNKLESKKSCVGRVFCGVVSCGWVVGGMVGYSWVVDE